MLVAAEQIAGIASKAMLEKSGLGKEESKFLLRSLFYEPFLLWVLTHPTNLFGQ
jgi:hypothetical protein